MNWRELSNPAFITALVIMSLCAVGMKTAITHYNIHLQKKPIYAENGRLLRAIPAETANWRRLGQDIIEASEIADQLGTDNYITRFYVQKSPADGKPPRSVQLHAAYYTGMIDTVPHVPERCLTGAGMALVGGPWTVPIPLDASEWRPLADGDGSPDGPVYTVRLSNEYSTAGGGRRVNLPFQLSPTRPLTMRISRFSTPGGRDHFAGYFFIANGGWVSSAEGVRQLSFDLRNDYAYYLKVQVGSEDASTPEELAELTGSLLDDLLGELMTCIPDWIKVQQGLWPPDNPRRQTNPPPRP
jgi:hypothetical protein